MRKPVSLSCSLAIVMAFGASPLLPHPARAQEPALKALTEAARAEPSDANAQLALQRALVRAGRLSEAQTQSVRMVRASHGSQQSLYEAARVSFATGDSKRARSACQALVKKSPSDVLTHVCMARAFLIWRRSSRAQEHVDRALAVAPNHPEALLALGDLKRIQNEPAAAADAYTRVIKQDPRNASAQLGLALARTLQQQPDAAIEALRAALKADPEDPEIQFELGQRLSGAQSVKLLQAAVAGRPQWPDAQLALATAQLKAGDPGSAARRLQTLLSHDRGNAVARAQHGVALLELDKPKEAERELRKAVELSPNDYETSFALARLYERTGRHEDAFSQYRYTADLKRENATPLIAAAQLGLSLKRPVFAAALLQRALERAPRSAQALALYGDSFAARADTAAARTYYQRALEGEGPLDRTAVAKNLAELK